MVPRLRDYATSWVISPNPETQLFAIRASEEEGTENVANNLTRRGHGRRGRFYGGFREGVFDHC